MIRWQDLNCYRTSDTKKLGALLNDVAKGRDTLGDLTLTGDGAISEWANVLVHPDGVEPSWDSHLGDDIDWTGFSHCVEFASSIEEHLAKSAEDIEIAARAIDSLRGQFKRRAMVYQVEDKERAALQHGKPIDSYYDLSFEEWMKIRNAE